MTSQPSNGAVLVTGATGKHGGTSAHVVRSLIDAGRPVRVFARTLSERTEAFSALGAEIALGDFTNRKSVIAAMDGVDTATFTYPIASGIVEAAATFASAAKELSRPPRLVVMSMAVAHPQSPSHLGRAQWLAEDVMQWSGLDLTILRIAALFFENIVALHGRSIRATSEFSNSFGSGQVPWISGLDAARLVVSAISKPELFAGAPVHYPPGVEFLRHEDIAWAISDELKRPIEFRSVSRDEWAATLLEEAETFPDSIINADMAKHISAVGEALSGEGKGPIRAPDSRELQRLTGSTPQTFKAFLRDNRSSFAR